MASVGNANRGACLRRALPFSKYDPNRPPQQTREGATQGAQRRIMVLRVVNPLVFAYTALGFGFIVYWSARKWTPHPLAFTLLSGGTAIAGYALGRLWAYRARSPGYQAAWILALLATVGGFAVMGLWLLQHW